MIYNELANIRKDSEQCREFKDLRRISARIGSNPFLIQASTGNASIKINGNIWIKASGKWLADAQSSEIFVPLELAVVRKLFTRGCEMWDCHDKFSGNALQPSIETPMHAVLPHRVVLHVHSINTIAWAVLEDGQSRLRQLLAGLRWRWIPYVDSGLDLAREITAAMSRSPETDVFVLANHGLVVCGKNCSAVDRLLHDVEERLAVQPRSFPTPDLHQLQSLAKNGDWEIPGDCALHALGNDPISRRILDDGVLFPCQATFFGAQVLPFRLVQGSGILIARSISRAERAMLTGLAQIILRIPQNALIRYLSESELRRISTANSEHYLAAAKAK